MFYQFYFENPQRQYLKISFEFDPHGKEVEVQLPAWRPGRYELGNFAKNVRGMKACDPQGNDLSMVKITKDRWKIESSNVDRIEINYECYAHELNAGSSFLDEEQMYVNPVNCCLYVVGRQDEVCSVQLHIPSKFDVATSMKVEGANRFTAENYHELADSPFVASSRLQKESYEVAGVQFHIWFNGEVKPDWKKIIDHFKKFTEEQINEFGAFPVSEFHFINQITPYSTYHGVEHLKSTVVAFGPSYDIMGKLYSEFLGVSSHELYHVWNIKTIRPAEMAPYDYSRENYSKLGLVAEGVTTYMGDLMLLRSGVFSEAEYFKELEKNINRHFLNAGRFSKSVAESSWDTWLNGYAAGPPNSKTSIYTEGCLLAFCLDVMLRRSTANARSLSTVMCLLYERFGTRGYTLEDYKAVSEEVGGISLDRFFINYVYGVQDYELILRDCLGYLGLKLEVNPEQPVYYKLGLQGRNGQNGFEVLAVLPESCADQAGIKVGDTILAINGYTINKDFDAWLQYFENDTIRLSVSSRLGIVERDLNELGKTYCVYKVEHSKDLFPKSNGNLLSWSSN